MSKERFAMVSMAMLSDPRLSGRQFKILCALKMFADSKTGEAHPKKEQISNAVGGLAHNTIAVETSALVKLGWIKKTGSGGFSTPATYTVFNEPVTSHKTLPVNQSQNATHNKKTTSHVLCNYQSRNVNLPVTKHDLNQSQNVTAQVTDHKHTNNRPITDHIAATEIITPKTAPQKALVPAKAGPVKIDPVFTEFQQVCRQTWESYATAYQARYGIDPVRNARINTQVVQFCKRIPRDDAPHVAAHFVGSNSSFYVSKGHQFGNLLADAEKLRTEWATNRSMTTATARQIDATQSNFNSVEQALTMMQQRKQA